MNELLEQQKQMENSTFRVVKRKLKCEYENSPFGNSQTQMICNQKKSNLNHHFVGGNGIVDYSSSQSVAGDGGAG